MEEINEKTKAIRWVEGDNILTAFIGDVRIGNIIKPTRTGYVVRCKTKFFLGEPYGTFYGSEDESKAWIEKEFTDFMRRLLK